MSFINETIINGTAVDINDKRLTQGTGEINPSAPIVELMDDYTASFLEETGYTYEDVYVGAVKNGNKLTFVVACNITKTSSGASNYASLIGFSIPSDIGAKLYPVQVGVYSFLSLSKINIFSNLTNSVETTTYFNKSNNTSIDLRFLGNNLVVDTKYYYRYEATFLLSDDITA